MHTAAQFLELIEPEARQQVHDALFGGRYRDVENPERELRALVYACRQDRLRQERDELARAGADALTRGDLPRARDLALQRQELNRRACELEQEAESDC